MIKKLQFLWFVFYTSVPLIVAHAFIVYYFENRMLSLFSGVAAGFLIQNIYQYSKQRFKNLD